MQAANAIPYSIPAVLPTAHPNTPETLAELLSSALATATSEDSARPLSNASIISRLPALLVLLLVSPNLKVSVLLMVFVSIL
jgi:hypothetical protein